MASLLHPFPRFIFTIVEPIAEYVIPLLPSPSALTVPPSQPPGLYLRPHQPCPLPLFPRSNYPSLSTRVGARCAGPYSAIQQFPFPARAVYRRRSANHDGAPSRQGLFARAGSDGSDSRGLVSLGGGVEPILRCGCVASDRLDKLRFSVRDYASEIGDLGRLGVEKGRSEERVTGRSNTGETTAGVLCWVIRRQD